jgi:VWFA-related protein
MSYLLAIACRLLPLWLSAVPLIGQVPSFRAEVEMVHLVCTVVDRGGNYVTDLGIEDFQVFENGRQQEIQFFSHSSGNDGLPVFLVLLIDTSDSIEAELNLIQRMSAWFLDDVLRIPEVRAAAVKFSTRVTLLLDFSQSIEELRIALQETEPEGGTRLYDGIWLAVKELLGDKNGRRFIVLFSDGADNHSLLLKEEVLRKLQAEHVTVFAVGVEDPLFGGSDFEALREICRQTGGFFATAEAKASALEAALDRIRIELRQQYTLGYVSNIPKTEGAFREVQIRVKRRGIGVNHRRGYYVE